MSRGNTVKTTLGAKRRIKGVRSKNGKGRNKEKKWNWAVDLVKAQSNFFWAFEQ
jgi:hypothetical protein